MPSPKSGTVTADIVTAVKGTSTSKPEFTTTRAATSTRSSEEMSFTR